MVCHGLNVQGVVFDGADHYAVRNLPAGGIDVFCWYDDPSDWPPGQRWARVVTIQPLAPDARFAGAINTAQRHVIYAEPVIRAVMTAAYAGNPIVRVRPWSDFTPPQAKTFNGQWVAGMHHEAHCTARSICGWREWTDGLDPSELDDSGRVKDQRRLGRFVVPDGTRTYYHNPAAGPDIHGAINPNSFGLTPSGATNESGTINQTGQTAFSAVTPANQPASAAWPTTGVYRYQIDATVVGADLVYGLLNLGSGLGHFGRVNAGATADQQTIAQNQASFSSSGLNIASITNPAWTSGAIGDRFEIVVASHRVVGHGNQSITLQLGESDDFADGPWPSAIAQAADALFFGTML